MRVIHAVPHGETVFLARSLITEETALICTTGTRDKDRIADFFGERFVQGTEK
jgi:hypothetical protein